MYAVTGGATGLSRYEWHIEHFIYGKDAVRRDRVED